MSGVYLQALRECDHCSTRAPIEVVLNQRDGQLTAKIDEATPDGWTRKQVRGYGHGSHTVIVCPECAPIYDGE